MRGSFIDITFCRLKGIDYIYYLLKAYNAFRFSKNNEDSKQVKI